MSQTPRIRGSAPATPATRERLSLAMRAMPAQKPLPGCPTKTTGVPNKNYRGPRQGALFKIAAKQEFLCCVLGGLCFCFSCNVMLLNNNYRENGEVVCGDR